MSDLRETPSYYAILTADVRYDERLKPNEKLLFAEITALSNFRGYCNASNAYFAGLYKVHKNTVGSWVNRLVEYGYLKSELVYNEKKEIISRKLYLATPINKNIDTPINEKVDTYQRKDVAPINEKIEGNNTSNNITSINKREERAPAQPKFNALNELLKLGANEQHAKDWLSSRKKKLTQTALSALIREANKGGITIAHAVKVCAENSWETYKSHYNLGAPAGGNNATNPSHKLSAVERVRRANEISRAERESKSASNGTNLGVYDSNVRQFMD